MAILEFYLFAVYIDFSLLEMKETALIFFHINLLLIILWKKKSSLCRLLNNTANNLSISRDQ